jgi:hypothetical protein
MKTIRIIVVTLFIFLFGCKESSFELSDESRLPIWFDIPDGMTRDSLVVRMDYYVRSDGRKAVFKMSDKNNNVLREITGIQQGMGPIKLELNSRNEYPEGRPLYEIVTVDGKTDIVEHRVRGPVFHMTDDPAVWSELGVEQKK